IRRMTMSHQSLISGKKRITPWRAAVLVAGLVIGLVVGLSLILLGLVGDFLVDWLWFSELGYFDVFWTMITANAVVFCVVFAATAIVLWLNGWFALRHAHSLAPLGPSSYTTPNVLEFVRHRLPRPRVITGMVGLLAMLVAWGELHNWSV